VRECERERERKRGRGWRREGERERDDDDEGQIVERENEKWKEREATKKDFKQRINANDIQLERSIQIMPADSQTVNTKINNVKINSLITMRA
jgi:hypothetical protein